MVGPNGAGKSTLLGTLAGLLPPTQGTLKVLGLDPFKDRRELHQKTGYLGHRVGFYPELTGRENLVLHARLRRLAPTEVEDQLEKADLLEAADRIVAEYSHGMQRRLGLAKAMLGAPRLLILDEPDAGLDRRAHQRLRTRLIATPTTVVMSTHSPQAHLEWATQAWVIGNGHLKVLSGNAAGITKTDLDAMLEEVTP